MLAITTRFLHSILGVKNCLHFSSLYKIVTRSKTSFDSQIVYFFSLIRNKDGIIIDIGANKGQRSIAFAKEFPLSLVYAFEPVKVNAEVFIRNKVLFRLDNISLFENAIGNEDGTCEMVVPEIDNCKSYGHCTVVHDRISSKKNNLSFYTPIRRLDAMDELKYSVAPIVAMNIEVENFEWAVLQGGIEIIKKNKPVIFCQLADNYNKLLSLSLLKELNYVALVTVKGKLDYYDSKIHDNNNFIFVHRSVKLDPINEINRNLAAFQ